MAMTLEKVVPWGRSLEEYCAMFNLGEAELQQKILGCGDGPASFNAELTAHGGAVTSIDPLYSFNSTEIAERIAETFDVVLQQADENRHLFTWNHITSVEHLGQIRKQAMDAFIADYDLGRKQGRYLPHSLPKFPLDSRSFDLALCSHFLFLYSEMLSLPFHWLAIQEMLRVSAEVRIFPLCGLDSRESPHLAPICERLSAAGIPFALERVDYEFQRDGHTMLRIQAP